jgi:hypothetical protein
MTDTPDETVVTIPKTLYDLDDVLIAMHWVADTTESIFKHQEKLYIREERSPLTHHVRYLEAFVMNNILREYPFLKHYGPSKRWQLFTDTISDEPFGLYETLAEALQALLVADAKVSIEAQWRARFGNPK